MNMGDVGVLSMVSSTLDTQLTRLCGLQFLSISCTLHFFPLSKSAGWHVDCL